jgi:putative peptidoglycan lipid II flippase
MTASALVYYSVGLWAFSGVRVIVSAFYALQDTCTPAKISVVTFIAYLVSGLLLMSPMKHNGLALALSISSAINFTLLVFFLKKKMPQWSLMPVLLSISKIFAATAVMSASVILLNMNLFSSTTNPGKLVLILQVMSMVIVGILSSSLRHGLSGA